MWLIVPMTLTSSGSVICSAISSGILSFAFGDAGHLSASIILGMYLVVNFLVLEARRYRYFDVWKNRFLFLVLLGGWLGKVLLQPEGAVWARQGREGALTDF
ncbi:MAG: DUF2270 domain-containing protein [Thermoanaerobaculia bacterium]